MATFRINFLLFFVVDMATEVFVIHEFGTPATMIVASGLSGGDHIRLAELAGYLSAGEG